MMLVGKVLVPAVSMLVMVGKMPRMMTMIVGT